MREAWGPPAWVLLAGMIGFGALARESGLGMALAVASSGLIWALPGQVVMTEMIAVGASGLAVVLAVSLTATRFLPMTMTLVPQLHEPRRGRLFPLAQLIAMTTWASMMRHLPLLPPERRSAYFAGFGLVCWGISVPGTAIGYLIAGTLPAPVSLGLVFLNPLFFLLLFAEVKQYASRLALAIGAVAGPLVYQVAPGWSLLVTGLCGGTLAWLLAAKWKPDGR